MEEKLTGLYLYSDIDYDWQDTSVAGIVEILVHYQNVVVVTNDHDCLEIVESVAVESSEQQPQPLASLDSTLSHQHWNQNIGYLSITTLKVKLVLRFFSMRIGNKS